MAITTEKLLKLSQFQSGLQAAKNYTDGEVAKVNLELTEIKGNVSTNTGDITAMKGQIESLQESAYDDSEVRGLIAGNTANIGANSAAITTLNGSAETEGSVANTVAVAVAGIMENPDETINSIQELVDWTQEHAETALQLSNNVSANGTAIAGLQGKVDTGEQTVTAYVNAQGFLKAEDISINVATDEEVQTAINSVFAA